MQSVRTKAIQLLSENEKSSTYLFNNELGKEYILAYRKAGSVSGNHYHSGKSDGKNPERLLLLSGNAKLEWRKINSEVWQSCDLVAPCMVEIESNTIHILSALSDISFLEFNSLEEHKQDTFYP
jgi:hypothetical protein